MSDSDLDLSEPPDVPSEETLTKGLRDAVAKIFRTGKEEELTVKRVRLAAEKALGLEDGFFKSGEWKEKSNQTIRDEVETQEEARDNPPPESSPVVAPKRSQPPPKKAAAKRGSTVGQKPRKRQKTRSPTLSSDDLSTPPDKSKESEESEEDVVEKKPRRSASAPSKPSKKKQPAEDRASDSSELSDVPDEVEAEKSRSKSKESPMRPKRVEDTKGTGAKKVEDSESELSEVLDEVPKPKRKRSTSAAGKTKKPKKEPASKSKENQDLDPDQAEIKRLQGWLIKCGIRKMWHRELAPYDNPKSKIRHLKGMLKDVGMEGRYSVEKAKRIKEQRELKADLEMVQEGARRWGADGAEDEESEEEKPRRRLARGLKNFDFLGDDGEETD